MMSCREPIVDPCVSLLESVSERGRRLPAKQRFDQAVVRVSAIHSRRRADEISPSQLHICDCFDEIDETVNSDRFAAPDVDWLRVRTAHQQPRPPYAIVDVLKASRLFSGPPDLDL